MSQQINPSLSTDISYQTKLDSIFSFLYQTQVIRTPFSLLLLSLLLLLLTIPLPVSAQEPGMPPSTTQGRIHWVENCQPCHGPTGQGDGPSAAGIPDPLPDFSDPVTARQLVPAKNFETIKNGRIDKLMPPWKDRMTDAQIWDAAAYVWLLSTTPQNLDTGETIYQEQCASCHGESGAGDGPAATPSMPDFTNVGKMVQHSQADLRANYQASTLHDPINGLSDEELWQALDYIRTFSFVVPQRNGVLTGQVINGTDGQPQGNIEVTLRGFQDNAEIVTLTTQTNSEGQYTFEKLPAEHTIFYMLEGAYQNVAYVSDEPIVFTPNSTETKFDLKVYETTTSDEAINIGQLHYILAFIPGAVNVAQIFVLNNQGDRTYIGQDGQTFTFALPSTATNVNFQEEFPGARFFQTDSGFADTAPITPKAENFPIAVTYDIPFADDTLTIDIPIPGDVNSLSVLMTEQGAKLTSAQLQFMETRQMQGDTFAIYAGTGLRQGDMLTLQLSSLDDLEFTNIPGVPAGAAASTNQPVNQDLLRWMIIGLGGLVIVVAVVVYPRRHPQLAQPSDLGYNDPQTQQQRLLLLLARLDETFEAGELDEKVYHQIRARYKAELAQLMEE